MPQYLAPGVYVEEVSSGSHPIAGTGTSTAGFVGIVGDDVTMPFRPGRPGSGGPADDDRYPLAPSGQAQLITSWQPFKDTFGDFGQLDAGGRPAVDANNAPITNDNTTLAHAVYGFFNNGGTRCWVTRVAHGADDAATQTAAIAALAAFDAIDEIAIVAAPGFVSDEMQT